MWLTCLVSLTLLNTITSAATAASADKVLSNHAAILADSSADLALSLYLNMAKGKGVENILISPVVVASSLGLVALGGKGSTTSEVKKILNAAKLQDEQLHAGFEELLSELSDPKSRNVTWKIGSRLYGPSSATFVDHFVKSSKKHYRCDHSKINFRDKKNAVKSINEWAAKSTDGKLPEVTKDVENMDGAMIINAMYFKPHWDEQFHPTMVDNRGFLVSSSYTVSLQMMHRTASSEGLNDFLASTYGFKAMHSSRSHDLANDGLFDFYDDTTNKVYLLSMPLAHKMSTMVLIMPYHVEPLQRLEKMLNKKQLDTWMGKMKQTVVAVSLPKVSMEVSHNLQKQLQELGLTEAVNRSKADLSNISGKKDLYLSAVLHAAALEWDTHGNEIDTSIFGSDKLKNPKLFYADHPFIFLVKDKKTNSVLFIGRVVRPKGEKMRDEL